MANAKKYTRANLVDTLSAILADMSDDDISKHTPDGFTPDDVRAKLDKERANLAKVANRPKSESAASKRNNHDAHVFATTWDNSKVFTLADIAEIIPTRISMQSRVAVVNVLMRKGLIAKADKVDGHTAYRFTTND